MREIGTWGTTAVRLPVLTILYLAGGGIAASPAQAEFETRQFWSRHAPSGGVLSFSAPDRRPKEPVQLAQNYDFDVYIDPYGREVIVDARTGVVVEIRPPAPNRLPPPPPPPVERLREFGGQIYDFTDPREVERYRRDRWAATGRDVPAERYDPQYSEEPPYGEELPDFGGEPAWGQGGSGIDRAPLAPPDPSGDVAAVPEFQERTPDAGRPPLQSDNAISAPGVRGASEAVAGFQVLLDRAGASPGVIDGQMGDNVNKAISSYREITGQSLRTYDSDWVKAELERTGGPAFTEYTITAEDAAGSYIASIPEDYGDKARLERLSYTSVVEKLAERFHMDEKYLIALNPGVNFNRPGMVIKVVQPGKAVRSQVARIIADKSAKQVHAYDEDGRLVATYPATIGSADTPSPTGEHEVARVAFNPEYTYNPKINFKQGNNDKVLTIPPGPNGPVGSVWIALSKPSYGIHGTPDPSKIGKTASHGCVRLTNWDAQELAKLVKPGVSVAFVE